MEKRVRETPGNCAENESEGDGNPLPVSTGDHWGAESSPEALLSLRESPKDVKVSRRGGALRA